MSALLTADVHMTDNPREAHRWGLWKWLRNKIKAQEIEKLFILGDLTDAKDRHSAQLVNRIVGELELICAWCEIFIVKGNHDFVDENNPFFEFVGALPNTYFYKKVADEEITFAGKNQKVLFLPSTKDYENEWQGLDFKEFDYIFCHATFEGCLSENGTKMRGIPPQIFSQSRAKIWAGDIHVPQSIGPVEYVGAPYRTRFGDAFDPRVVHIDNRGKVHDLHYPAPTKIVADLTFAADPADTLKRLNRYLKDLQPGDQVKVRVQLERGDWERWPALRQAIIERVKLKELVLSGPEAKLIRPEHSQARKKGSRERVAPEQLIRDYGASVNASASMIKAGVELMENVK